eukprot:COSAG02_NODE_15671_length_1150_cov_1.084681_2_plen_184_part_00
MAERSCRGHSTSLCWTPAAAPAGTPTATPAATIRGLAATSAATSAGTPTVTIRNAVATIRKPLRWSLAAQCTCTAREDWLQDLQYIFELTHHIINVVVLPVRHRAFAFLAYLINSTPSTRKNWPLGRRRSKRSRRRSKRSRRRLMSNRDRSMSTSNNWTLNWTLREPRWIARLSQPERTLKRA